jgi:general secretion pathway protein H
MAKTRTWATGNQRAGTPVSLILKPVPLATRATGFTLLELLVAISIVAIVLAVSAPAMQRLYKSSRYHGAVNDVVTLLTSARYSAIRKGKDMDVLINPEIREIRLGEKIQSLPEDLNIEVLGARELNRDGAGVIRFYADGSSSGGAVDVRNDNGFGVQIQVDWLLGRVSLCKEDCGEPI